MKLQDVQGLAAWCFHLLYDLSPPPPPPSIAPVKLTLAAKANSSSIIAIKMVIK